jgi:hypothetical protein
LGRMGDPQALVFQQDSERERAQVYNMNG